ncbi:MAG: hypothetical protein ACO3HJ_00015 [Methylophilaceae bacterium]
MKVEIPVEIYETDYVLYNVVEQKPIEGFDTIYAMESIIELFNDGFFLQENEKFVKITELPQDIILKYARSIIASNQTKKCIS